MSDHATGLEGIRVIEIGGMVGVPYTTKLLADLGADVVKIEPPRGDRSRTRGPFRGDADPEASGIFLYLNTNKRSVEADIFTDAGRELLHGLMSGADLVVHDLRGSQLAAAGLGVEEVRDSFPNLVVTAVTPFGLTGPYAEFRAEEITVSHAGGWANLTPGCSKYEDLPPLKVAGAQTDYQSAMAAAAVSLASVDRAQRTGHGEYIDLSKMSYTASMLEASFVFWSYLGEVAGRLGTRILNPWKIVSTSDGLVFVVCVEEDQWDRLKEIMGHPEWAELEIFESLPARFDNDDLLHLYIEEWTSQFPTMELFHRGQSVRVAFAPVNTVEQMASDPHLLERDFLCSVEQPGVGDIARPGAPYRLERPWWGLRTPAPRQGEHQGAQFSIRERRPVEPARAAERPLAGITIADFSWVWAGPFCGLNLAHLGADVIKIESAARPDLGRRIAVHAVDMDPTPDTNGYFNQWNQGKRGITLDLGTAEGLALAKRLALECDAVLSNYSTGVMERFGLSYNDLAKQRPDVIVATISGYGNVGPYSDYIGYGPTTGPLSGLSSLTGYVGGEPMEVGVSLGDPAAGIATAYAIVAALVARRRTGEGQWIDTSLWEATTVGLGEAWMEWALTGEQPERMGNRDPIMAPHNCYLTAGDDQWISIACATDEEWAAMALEIDRDMGSTLSSDSRFSSERSRKANEDALDEAVTRWTEGQDRWSLTNRLQSLGVAAMPTFTSVDLDIDPHLAERGTIERLNHPVVGERAHVGVPWLLHDGPNGVRAPAPTLGQHTAEVLSEVLGLEAEEIERLSAKGVLQ